MGGTRASAESVRGSVRGEPGRLAEAGLPSVWPGLPASAAALPDAVARAAGDPLR
ncbi:hypothetical protein ABZ079_09150 [Streptomyces sp. NPDC006314]|uniref:hypothetical protein n=1 Tax=Streptomyces sp. NPDC006314 TaxID=3154475 RepID=UPI0033AFE603